MSSETINMISKISVNILIYGFVFAIIQIIFKRIKKRSSALHIRFSQRIAGLLVIVFFALSVCSIINPQINPQRYLIGSSALIVAIIGFASQPVISDFMCGFLISVNKPFEIGDRIIVDGYEPGVVEDITLRHTVLRIYDDIRIIIPNSQLNSRAVQNTSYREPSRGVHLTFSVSYDTNVPAAMNIIRDCVAESPYTLEVENNGVTEDSGPVYFLKFADSALILETTLRVDPKVSTYTATTDVNSRVLSAFRKHGIEIPYQYINIVTRDGEELAQEEKPVQITRKSAKPLRRHFRTDTIKLYQAEDAVVSTAKISQLFAKRVGLDKKSSNQLQLVSEEMVSVLGELLYESSGTFYIEGSGHEYNIHIHMSTDGDPQNFKKLLELSTSGKNEAPGIYAKICNMIREGINLIQNGSQNSFQWSTGAQKNKDTDILEKTILLAFSESVSVAVTRSSADLTIKMVRGAATSVK